MAVTDGTNDELLWFLTNVFRLEILPGEFLL